MRATSLSVVVPIYNEQAALPAFLQMAAGWPANVELVLSDGGSTDRSRELVAQAIACEARPGCRLVVVDGAKGRGAQCVRGVEASGGDALMFMHVDERVDPAAIAHVCEALAAGVAWGCLTLRWLRRTPVYRFGEWMSNLRVRCQGIPFGDQCPFMTRELYDAVGGMPDLPLMEDYELALRLRARGERPHQLRDEVWASPRRFEQGGPVRVALQMRRLRRMYRAGVPADELGALYRDVR